MLIKILAPIFLISFSSYSSELLELSKTGIFRENLKESINLKKINFSDKSTEINIYLENESKNNLKKIKALKGNSFFGELKEIINSKLEITAEPKKMDFLTALDLLCGEQSREVDDVSHFVHCELNDGYKYRKTSFSDIVMVAMGDASSFGDELTGYVDFSKEPMPETFKALLSINQFPSSVKLFKKFLITEIILFSLVNEDSNGFTLNKTLVFSDEIILQYLQKAFIDEANKSLEKTLKNDWYVKAGLPNLKLVEKNIVYDEGVELYPLGKRVQFVNFPLITGTKTGTSVGQGSFRQGGIVIDRSDFGKKIGPYSFSLQLYYYFICAQFYNSATNIGLEGFYSRLFEPFSGFRWTAWGELFAYPNDNSIRSIVYWKNFIDVQI